MRPVPVGTKGSFTRVISADDLASGLDASLAPAMPTPTMIGMMELAAIDALRSFLEPGESSLGMAIEVRHLAVTPEGHRVRAEAEVTGCDGRRIKFQVRAVDETEEIGIGVHRRAVVRTDGFDQRLKEKLKA